MSQEHRDEPDDRGAVVLSPKAPAEGTFALLVPDNMHWEVSRFGGALRLDFRPMSPAERARQRRGDKP